LIPPIVVVVGESSMTPLEEAVFWKIAALVLTRALTTVEAA
jgi:hypothetical protein